MAGPSALARGFRKAAADLQHLDQASADIGAACVLEARRLVPVRSGRLRSSIGFRVGKTRGVTSQVTITAGGSRAVYAPVIQYGWPAHNIKPDPFINDAVDHVDQRGIIAQSYADRVDQIFTKDMP